MSLVLAHISDLHVSRFGEHVTSLRSRRLHGRLPRRGETWEPVGEVDGWHVERRQRQVRLVDDAGAVHLSKRIDPPPLAEVQRSFEQLVHERMRTEHSRLAANLPAPDEIDRLLRDDPGNTNLLFCRAAHLLREDRPDWVILTGDVTDDAVGYDLVLAALQPFVAARRVLAVPGNHDIYDSPLFVVPGHARKGRRDKRAAWARFADELGQSPSMPWIRDLGEGVIMCGLDSCIPARTPLSASGAVEPHSLLALQEQLRHVPADACKLAMLHHHVVNPPVRAVGMAPWQLGIRLRNARVVYDFFCKLGFRAVLNGHRHIGYRYHPSHAPLFVSAPSATLGCRSRAAPRPFYWRIEIADGDVRSVHERML